METTFLALFFISLAAGVTISTCRFIFSKLGQYTCALLCSLIIGVMASKFLGVDFSKLQSVMDSLKSLLFLLFIFATGYTNGPAIFVLFRKLRGPSNTDSSKNSDRYGALKFVLVGLVVFAVASLTVLCVKKILKDNSLVGAITAGSLTQTAILGLTANASPGEYSLGLNREVVFTLTYLVSTIATMVFCSYVIPFFSVIFGRKYRENKTENILSASAEELVEAEDSTAISFKFSPIPDRVGRAFVVKENVEYEPLKNQLAAHYVTLQSVLDPKGRVKTPSAVASEDVRSDVER